MNQAPGEVNFFVFLFIHIFICTYIVWVISPPCPPPPSPLSLPSLPGRTYSALFSNFVEEKTQAIIKAKCFC
jgi:hypothetical protein